MNINEGPPKIQQMNPPISTIRGSNGPPKFQILDLSLVIPPLLYMYFPGVDYKVQFHSKHVHVHIPKFFQPGLCFNYGTNIWGPVFKSGS